MKREAGVEKNKVITVDVFSLALLTLVKILHLKELSSYGEK